MQTLALGPSWLDPEYLVQTFCLIGLTFIVFAECGLLIGFFLPGDSLLFTAGLLVSTGILTADLWVVVALICTAAILGNFTGYSIGYKSGPAVFSRPESRFFKPECAEQTSEFFARYGGSSLILARFVPIVRTLTPVIAGTSRMPFGRFALFSTIGGLLWGISMPLLGYYLGKIEFVQQNLEFMVIGLAIVSVVPIWFELRRRGGGKPASDETPVVTDEDKEPLPREAVHQPPAGSP
jgi:membrane-associated protein